MTCTYPSDAAAKNAVAVRHAPEGRWASTSENWSSALLLAIGLIFVFTFVVGMATAQPAALTPAVGDTVRTFDRAGALVTWLVHVGTLGAIGAAYFRFFVVEGAAVPGADQHAIDIRGPVEQMVAAGCALGAVASIGTLPLRAAVVAGRPAAAFEIESLWFTLSSSFGAAALVRTAGLALLALVIHQRHESFHRPIAFVRGEMNVIGGISIGPVTVARIKAAGCIVLIVGSYAITGHAQASSPRWLLTGFQLVHLSAGAVWFGGVVALVGVTRRVCREGEAVEAASVLERFSLSAAIAVVAVSVSGSILAVSQLGSVSALWGTAYGRTILVKLCLVAVVMGIGGYNHRFLVPAVSGHEGREAWGRLWRTLRCEAGVLAGGVLLVTAFLIAGGVDGMLGS